MVVVPPAASTAAMADALKPWAETETLRVNSPRPRILTSAPFDTSPLANNASGVISSRPDSSSVSRLTAWYSTRKGLLNPRSLGRRMAIGS